jgi:hypothetical protein
MATRTSMTEAEVRDEDSQEWSTAYLDDEPPPPPPPPTRIVPFSAPKPSAATSLPRLSDVLAESVVNICAIVVMVSTIRSITTKRGEAVALARYLYGISRSLKFVFNKFSKHPHVLNRQFGFGRRDNLCFSVDNVGQQN